MLPGLRIQSANVQIRYEMCDNFILRIKTSNISKICLWIRNSDTLYTINPGVNARTTESRDLCICFSQLERRYILPNYSLLKEALLRMSSFHPYG